MENISLSDFIPYFPRVSDPLYNGKIQAKKELRDLSSNEKRSDTDLSNHQEVHRRMLMTPGSNIDKMIIFDEPGTGKTLKSIIIQIERELFYGRKFTKPALFLVNSNEIKDHISAEIMNVTGYYLFNEKDKREYRSAKEMKGNTITRRTAKSFQIETYISYYNELKKQMSGMSKSKKKEFIKNEASNRVLIFDEAHHLTTKEEKRKKADREFEDMVSKKDRQETIAQYKQAYNLFRKMILLSENSITQILTATPAQDTYLEYVDIFNMVLDKDNEIDKKEFKEVMKLEMQYDMLNVKESPMLVYLYERLKGKVSFVRRSDDAPTVYNVGNSFNLPNSNSKAVVYPSPTSPYQYRIMLKSKEKKSESGTKQNVFKIYERSAANFIFPKFIDTEEGYIRSRTEGYYGKEGFDKYVTKDDSGNYVLDRRIVQLIEKSDDPEEDESNLEELRELSAKFYTIIDLVSECTVCAKNGREECKRSSKCGPKEAAYCYTSFVKGPGAILLSLVFKARGYSQYNGGRLTTKAERYALITGETKSDELRKIKDAFNAPENKYGEYLRVVIGSPKSSESIGFTNVRQTHILDPYFHDSVLNQVTGRGLRYNSLLWASKEERYIKIFRHAVTVYKTKPYKGYEEYRSLDEIKPEDPIFDEESEELYGEYKRQIVKFIEEGSEEGSIDYELYSISEQKSKPVKRIMRICKMVAVDSDLMKYRNIKDIDMEGNISADFDTVNYDSIGVQIDVNGDKLEPIPEDLTTYHRYFAHSDITNIQNKIKNMFRNDTELYLYDIFEKIQYDNKTIMIAISQMINNSMIVRNKLGVPSYVMESGNYLYLVDIAFQYGNELSLLYSRKKFLSIGVSFEDSFKSIYDLKINMFLEEIENIDDKEEIQDLFVLKEKEIKTSIIERLFIKEFVDKKKLSRKERYLMNLMEPQIYMYSKHVVFHTINYRKTEGAKHGATALGFNKEKLGGFRVINLKTDDEWRTAIGADELEYKRYAEEVRTNKYIKYNKKYDVFGIYNTVDGEFRVKYPKPNERSLGLGEICNNISPKTKIYSIIDQLTNSRSAQDDYKNMRTIDLCSTLRDLLYEYERVLYI